MSLNGGRQLVHRVSGVLLYVGLADLGETRGVSIEHQRRERRGGDQTARNEKAEPNRH
jgi:hypothetical protein